MSSHNGMNNKIKKATKPIATIPMAGAIVTAAILLSGLSLIGSYQQPVLAQQQNMTGAGGATGGATNTTTTSGGGATQGGNATMTGAGAEGNDSVSQVRMHLEEARTALQNNDTQGALMNLDLALNALGGASGAEMNLTATTGGTEGGTEGGTTGGTEGGTTGGTEGGTTGGTEGGGILEGIFGGGQ
ncbi:MAG TPA: hypothetical protein VHF65_06810 [Nitrososphaera sp.]|nr:hypothetical protein [Nitrososphaera sp.]